MPSKGGGQTWGPVVATSTSSLRRKKWELVQRLLRQREKAAMPPSESRDVSCLRLDKR